MERYTGKLTRIRPIAAPPWRVMPNMLIGVISIKLLRRFGSSGISAQIGGWQRFGHWRTVLRHHNRGFSTAVPPDTLQKLGCIYLLNKAHECGQSDATAGNFRPRLHDLCAYNPLSQWDERPRTAATRIRAIAAQPWRVMPNMLIDVISVAPMRRFGSSGISAQMGGWQRCGHWRTVLRHRHCGFSTPASPDTLQKYVCIYLLNNAHECGQSDATAGNFRPRLHDL